MKNISENLAIQGLHDPQNAGQSFWSLKARIELAVFSKKEKELNEN